jgi:uncharacterized protein with ParB-like and HNH nuclease domain
MKADATNVRGILYTGDQYVIPQFQRYYVWEKKDWNRLWEDILDLLDEEDPKPEHFFGSIVCAPVDHRPGRVPAYLIIDGQQRTVTIVVLLCAIRDRAMDLRLEKIAGEIRENYLIHKYKEDLERYKVILRLRDRQTLFDLVDEKKVDTSTSRIMEAYQFFTDKIGDFAKDEEKLNQLLVAVAERLPLVIITLKEENPFSIFETLNATGQKLTEADMIRNYVFMKVPFPDQDKFDNKEWQPFESLFLESNGYPAISYDDFYRHFLMRKGNYVRPKEVYIKFKEEAEKAKAPAQELLNTLRRHAKYYILFNRPNMAEEPELRLELRRLAQLEISTSYPLLLNLFDRYSTEKISRSDLAEMLRWIQSFHIRRLVVGEITRPYTRWFPGIARELQEHDEKASLLKSLEKRVWPDDERFVKSLVGFQIYYSGLAYPILSVLEDSRGHKEPVDLTKLQVEHVMPQTIGDDAEGNDWKMMLGQDWQKIHSTWLHTVGNLTLTAYNPEASNLRYSKKRQIYAESHLELNKYFANVEQWNEAEIRRRGEELAREVAVIWRKPTSYLSSTDSASR